MGKLSLRSCAVIAGTFLALATSFAVASAHYVFTAGKYRVAIGWQNEPAFGTDTFVGEQNAIQVFVDIASEDNPKGTPVSTLNQDCTHPDFQVTVTVGTTTSSPFCPAPVYDPDTGNGRLDEYDYALIPTVVGAYTFRIFGSIDGTPINTTVTSGPTTFDSIARLELRRVSRRSACGCSYFDKGRCGESARGKCARERAIGRYDGIGRQVQRLDGNHSRDRCHCAGDAAQRFQRCDRVAPQEYVSACAPGRHSQSDSRWRPG